MGGSSRGCRCRGGHGRQGKALPKVFELHREEWWLRPHDMPAPWLWSRILVVLAATVSAEWWLIAAVLFSVFRFVRGRLSCSVYSVQISSSPHIMKLARQ